MRSSKSTCSRQNSERFWSPNSVAHSERLKLVLMTMPVFLIQLTDQMEQEGAIGPVERQVTGLVENDQRVYRFDR